MSTKTKRRVRRCQMGVKTDWRSCGGEAQPAVYRVAPVEAKAAKANKPDLLCGLCAETQASAYIGFGWGVVVTPLDGATTTD